MTACGANTGPASGGVPSSFYGIVSGASLDHQDFTRMADAGVGALRFVIAWPLVQYTRNGPFDWSATDALVAEAAAEHIQLLATVTGTPAFDAHGCSTHGCSSHIYLASRPQRRGWTSFVRAAVRRYGRHGAFWTARPDIPYEPVTRWQIWNEQNNPNQGNPAKLYARLLKLSHRAISSVDPKARIITGGMFGTPKGSQRGGVTAWSYLNLLYEDRAAADFDAVALHPYASTIFGLSYQIRKIRQVMKAHGDASTQVLITEIGWGSSKKRRPGTGSRGAVLNVGPAKQKTNLTKSFRLLTSHRNRWKIGGVYWYAWKDPENPPPGLCAFCYSSGLYKANGRTAKPALSAFERFTRKMKGKQS